MNQEFFKYQGTGNDFVMIDDRASTFDLSDHPLVQKLCHRKFGIGADGLILIREHADYDFELIYFNADASQSLCGNGSRCGVHFARHLGMISDRCTFLAIDGPHEAHLEGTQIHLRMNDVARVDFLGEDLFIDTGSPHYIKYVTDLGACNISTEGKRIRYSEPYKLKGVNVNFVEISSTREVHARTYERGVEDETLSCGTGVTAIALALHYRDFQSPVSINTPGGTLTVSFTEDEGAFRDIFLIGPAEMVFRGEFQKW